MRWFFKILLRLLVLAALAFAIYALFADLPPPTERTTVELEPSPPNGTEGSAN